MPFYKCIVYDELGKTKKLIKEANDQISLKAILKRDNLVLKKAEVLKEKEPNVFFSVSSKIKHSEVVSFLRQFAVLINASVSIADSLNTLKVQNYTPVFQKVVRELYNDVISGKLLSEAFEKHPKVFPKFFVEMVAIGEVSGSLDSVLKSMADYYEKDNKVKQKAKSAALYPTILFVLINAVILFMSFFILPKFSNIFKDLGSADGPQGFSKTVFDIGEFIRNNLLYIIGVIILLMGIGYLYFKTKKGKITKDWFALNLPLIGKINRAIITSRFTKAFVILLESGMNISDCMENLKKILDNSFFSTKFDYAIEEVKRGKSIARSIGNTQMFPPILSEMISVGEKSGNLEEVLSSTASFYDDEVERTISKATTALEPIMIIFLGIVVAAVLMAIYLPMIDIMNQI